MKILAIRGENLASLANEFVVDLTSAPMSGEGLFAITGQTGSGKSTLLDAMCLALFDKTPRLSKGGAKIGRDDEDKERQAGSSNPRTILRRGTGAGYAEVDFLGVDDVVYRSRWIVRRSRNKPSGRLQGTRLELWNVVTNERLDSDKKTATLRLIEAKLGLGFDQFRRSVLLPQGEFAAFLKADEEERGALLERMTGTKIYRDISIAAFQRAKEEKVASDRLDDQLSVLKLLEPEQIEALKETLATSSLEEAAQGAALAAAESAVGWHTRRATLQEASAAAAAGVQQAEEALAVLAPVAAELAAIASVEALRPLLEGEERARRASSAAAEQQARLTVELTVASESAQQMVADSDGADAALSAARARQEELSEALSQAAALDGEISSLGRAVAVAHREAREAAAALAASTEEAAGLEAQLASLLSATEAESAWLSENTAWRVLAEGWGRWSRELQRAAAADAERRSAAEALPTSTAAAAAAVVAASEAAEGLAAAESALGPLRETVAQAREALAACSSASLQERQRALYQRRQRLDRLLERRQQILDLRERRASREQAVANAKAQVQIAEATMTAAEEQRKQLGWMLSEAERFLEQVRADEVLTARREGLQEGQACPLCGATEHPWAGAQHSSAAIFQVQADRVRELREQISALSLRAQQARSDAERLQGEGTATDREVASLGKRQVELEAEWVAAAQGLDLPPLEEANDSLMTAMYAADAELKSVEEALAEVAGLRSALEAAEQARDAAAERCEAARGRLRSAEERKRSAERALEGLRTQHTRAESIWQECAEALSEPLGHFDWAAALEEDAAALERRCAEQAAHYLAARKQVIAGEVESSELRSRLQATGARLLEREGASRRLKAASLERAEQLKALQSRRMRLLGGQDTDAVRSKLRQSVAIAEQRAGQIAGLRASAERRVTERSARLASATAEASRRVEEADAAVAVLEAALADKGVALSDVQARLQRPPEWVAVQQEQLSGARAVLARAQAVRSERQEQLSGHEASPPELASAAEAAEARAEARAAHKAASQQRYKIEVSLDRDTEQRQQSAALLARRDAQRAKWEHWEVINKLIGSATGKTFSQFAQSLTLDALLMQANQHLQGLSRRYSLMRIPAEDLVLQIVDHYHGDEVRSVNSLSGGESFLVSLALALGLATLSAKDTRIGSLFIDEGFGTLDPDTLDVALSSLDALQASGRQVGLISHVPGMAERIGVQIQVVPRGGGRSIVRTIGG